MICFGSISETILHTHTLESNEFSNAILSWSTHQGVAPFLVLLECGGDDSSCEIWRVHVVELREPDTFGESHPWPGLAIARARQMGMRYARDRSRVGRVYARTASRHERFPSHVPNIMECTPRTSQALVRASIIPRRRTLF